MLYGCKRLFHEALDIGDFALREFTVRVKKHLKRVLEVIPRLVEGTPLRVHTGDFLNISYVPFPMFLIHCRQLSNYENLRKCSGMVREKFRQYRT